MIMFNEYYTAGEKEFLIRIAMKSLEKFLLSGEKFEPQTINKKLWEKRGVFVTLTLGKNLRGCMGNVEPAESLIVAIRNNVLLAATDPRFKPLTASELKSIKIEISVLSELEKKPVAKIKSGDGVFLKRGNNSATYLPSVWKSFKSKDEFMTSLCEKAGLDFNLYTDPKTELWVYSVTSFN